MSGMTNGMADVRFLRLWDLYHRLLTSNQQEVTDLYFNYDLSLTEIAEQKGVSKQSVSDCLRKCRRQLEDWEEKLGFAAFTEEESLKVSHYLTDVSRWTERMRAAHPELAAELGELEAFAEREFGAVIED